MKYIKIFEKHNDDLEIINFLKSIINFKLVNQIEYIMTNYIDECEKVIYNISVKIYNTQYKSWIPIYDSVNKFKRIKTLINYQDLESELKDIKNNYDENKLLYEYSVNYNYHEYKSGDKVVDIYDIRNDVLSRLKLRYNLKIKSDSDANKIIFKII